LTHASPAAHVESRVQLTFSQPSVRAYTGPLVSCAAAGLQTSYDAHVVPSSHGMGSHALLALQRNPASQLAGVHAGPHMEPTPLGLHESATA
jgi:hypothetical protein